MVDAAPVAKRKGSALESIMLDGVKHKEKQQARRSEPEPEVKIGAGHLARSHSVAPTLCSREGER